MISKLTHDEKNDVIKERYKTIKKDIKKRKLNKEDYKLDRLTRDRVKRKIMRSSTQELAEIGFNALIDEACKFNPKKKE